jgi:hypothetical protein
MDRATSDVLLTHQRQLDAALAALRLRMQASDTRLTATWQTLLARRTPPPAAACER